MVYFSLIIPVYNRPDEVAELLESLALQRCHDFEVIVVEDGSQLVCEEVVKRYQALLNIKYFYKENSGPGLSRNYGAERATGEYFVFLDSDCIIPETYAEVLLQACKAHKLDAFGGPDRAHESFTDVQKAINYSMTSFFTTGGIRGRKQSIEKFHPRSFNMGISKAAWSATGGFSGLRFGEDIDMSIRIMEAGFKTCLLPEAYVYHKRRTSFRKFFKQVYNSGMARINLFRLHPHSLKIVHCLPATFLMGCLLLLVAALLFSSYFGCLLFLPAVCFFGDSLVKNRNLKVASLSVAASYIQLIAYGLGFLHAVVVGLIGGKPLQGVFVKNFYK